jgi:hypothetical protein
VRCCFQLRVHPWPNKFLRIVARNAPDFSIDLSAVIGTVMGAGRPGRGVGGGASLNGPLLHNVVTHRQWLYSC